MLQLKCHCASPVAPVDNITVKTELNGTGLLWLRYHTEGILPEIDTGCISETPHHTDNLWQSTCFELFVQVPGSKEYLEFNFAPSGDWAVYSFQSYRSGQEVVRLQTNPEIGCDASDSHFALEAIVRLPEVYCGTSIQVGLSAVILAMDGFKSYWALKHPAGNPDFHHGDCFAHKLLAAEKT